MTILTKTLQITSLIGLNKKVKKKNSLSKFLQLRFNLAFMSCLPGCLINAYVWFLAKLYFFIKPELLIEVQKHIYTVMKDYDKKQIKQLSNRVIKGLIKHYQEKMINGFLKKKQLREYLFKNISFDKAEILLKEVLKEERGVIIATGHYGALEFLPVVLAMKGYPTSVVAKFSSERLKKIIVPRFVEEGLEIIVPEDVNNVLRAASNAIQQNHIYISSCDEADEWHRDKGNTMEFLGQTLHPDRTLKVLSKRTGAIQLVGLLRRKGSDDYEFILERIPDECDEKNIQILKTLEKYIYRYPDQWYEWNEYEKFASAS